MVDALISSAIVVAPLVLLLVASARLAEASGRTITIRFEVTDAETGQAVAGCHVGACRASQVPSNPDAPLPLENQGWTNESGVAEIEVPESTPGLERVFAFTCHASYRNGIWPNGDFDRPVPVAGDAAPPNAKPLDLTAGDAEVSFAITHVAKTVWVAVSDGTRLATELWLPPGDGPWPVILERTPYGRGVHFDGRRFTQAGYAYVVQDVRGRFDSPGNDTAFGGCGWFGPTDGKDTVEWISRQSWSNGKIGTHGGSAMGCTQNFLAGAYPQGLDAQYILVAFWHYYSTIYQGGVFRKALVEKWLENNDFSPATIETLRAHPTYDAFWKTREVTRRVCDIGCPAFYGGGWFDCFCQGPIDAFVDRQYNGGPGARGRQKLIMGPWTHGLWWAAETGELEFPDADKPPVPVESLEWFDWQLKGLPSAFENSPAVAYYRMGDTSDPNAPGNDWQTSDVWPVNAVQTPLYLQPGHLLSLELPGKAEAHETYVYDPARPVPTVGGQNLNLPAGPFDQRSVENRPDVLLFTTEPLETPLEVTGRLKVVLFATSDRVDTDFTAKLTDVYPDGRSMLLADGILRARYRNSFSEPELMEPGKIYEFEIDLWSTSIVFNQGHRIRLAVSSSNAPRFEPNNNRSGLDEPPLVARNTIYFDAAHPSRIILPVVVRQE